jgi:hypothetical protein
MMMILHLSTSQLAELLLKNGADPNIGDKKNPVLMSITRGKFQITKLLINYGGDVRPYIKNISETTFEGVELLQMLKSPWTPLTHNDFPIMTRKSIETVFKLTMKNCQFSRVPKDILLIICSFIALRDI